MSASTELEPLEVRSLVHRKLDAATDDEVAAVHRMLLELEARRLWKELGDESAADWESGQLSDEKVADAVQTHRSKAARQDHCEAPIVFWRAGSRAKHRA